jgi:predicted solute-binding protein
MGKLGTPFTFAVSFKLANNETDETGANRANKLNHKWNSGEGFLRRIKERLGIRSKGRKMIGGESKFE